MNPSTRHACTLRRVRLAAGLCAALLGLALPAPSARAAAVLPDNFSDVRLASGLNGPTTMCRIPDGRVVFTERYNGKVRLIANDTLFSAAVGQVDSVALQGEQGFTGVAVDPGFPTRPYIYVQYDVSGLNVIRIARYTLTGDLHFIGDGQMTWDPASRYIVIGDLQDSTSAHNGGTLRFGPDGKLYSCLGNDLSYCKEIYVNQLIGKILRMDVSNLPDGPGGPADLSLITPPDNPFVTDPDPRSGLVWEKGLRNPFIYQIDPITGNIFIGDVGDNTYEELDLANAPGMDFGYPYYEGPLLTGLCPGSPPPDLTFPIYYYDRTEFLNGAVIITAGMYHVLPAARYSFPAEYKGSVFFSDLGEGFMRRIQLINGTWQLAPPVPGQPNPTDWAENMNGVSDYFESPDGALWYCRFTDQFIPNTGEIHRIIYNNPLAGASAADAPLEFAPVRPLPARGPVTFAWALGQPERVTISITDVSGREVARPVDGASFSAGFHSVTWNGASASGLRAAPGVYFARLDAGARRAVRRVILMR